MNSFPEDVPQASIFNRRTEAQPTPIVMGLEKLEVNEALKLPMYARILALEFHSRLAAPMKVATLRLEVEPVRAPHLRVQLWFENVRDVAILQLPTDGIICNSLQISDARAEGFTEMNWKIHNADVGNLLFYAGRAEVVSVYMVS